MSDLAGTHAESCLSWHEEAVSDLLPGEERLHETLQAELIEILASHHRTVGQVVHLEARLTNAEAGLHGYVRSVEAAKGRYSCEFIELHSHSGEVLDCEFFALLPPLEEASEASVLTLAKAAAVAKSRKAKAIAETAFDAVVVSCPFI